MGIKELGQKRLAICKTCPKFAKKTRQCRSCGCFLDVKSYMKNKHCPLGKWENGKQIEK